MSETRRLSIIGLPEFPDIDPGDDLLAPILAATQRAGEQLADGDVLVIAQKIVSKAEGRFVTLSEVEPSPRAIDLAEKVDKDPRLVEVIIGESTAVVAASAGVLVVAHRLGFVLANAGVDRSNLGPLVSADGERVLLLPIDPDRSAAELRRRIGSRCGVDVGVVINDSLGRPWRNGTVGFAIGAAGVASLHDLRGRPDRFGRPLLVSTVGHADELAAAASLLMGQADEGIPVVLVRGLPAPVPAQPLLPASALVRDPARDLFR